MFVAHLDLNPLIQGWEILSWSIDALGEEIDLLLVESVETVREMRCDPGGTKRFDARLLHASEHYHWDLRLANLSRPFDYLCGLTPDRFVMVSHGRNRQANSTLFDSEGNEVSRFWVGDYVSHLQADLAGRLWVSYADQGYGEDYSEWGLSCFDNQGQAVDPWWCCPMMDCYAMNVSKDGVWHCGYTDFSIVHVGFDRRQREWHNGVKGAKAIVAKGQRAALYGGYQERAQHITTLKLTDDGQAVVEGECIASLPGTQETPWANGRGPFFHVVQRGVWYRFDPFDR